MQFHASLNLFSHLYTESSELRSETIQLQIRHSMRNTDSFFNISAFSDNKTTKQHLSSCRVDAVEMDR